jgi:tRNA dimethylallyltransferase
MELANKRLIVISGATAIGKTSLSIKLAKRFNTEIISADSRQFYKELKIGAAPPSKEELASIPHHFIQHLSVDFDYNFGAYESDAIQKIYALFQEYDNLILVGGSGLYIDAITKGLDEFPAIDNEIKDNIILKYKEKGIAYLKSELAKKDSEYYKIVDTNNPHRIIRALSVINSSKKSFSSFLTGKKKNRNFRISHFSITMERDRLYERINKRVDIMMKSGLVNEVESLIPYKYKNALQTVGYRELFDYFEKKCSLQEVTEKIKQNTRRFAKRQISWFKRDKNIQHINSINAYNEIIELL